MSADYDDKSSDEVEREVESSRADVQETLRALSDRMSPGQLIDQAYDYVKSSGGSEFAQNMGRQVRDNPLPLLLISAGIGWLFMGGQPAAKRAIGGDDHYRRVPPSGRRTLGAPVESFGAGMSRTGAPTTGATTVRASSTYPAGSSARSSDYGSSADSSSSSSGPSMTERAAAAGGSAADSLKRSGQSVAGSISSGASSVKDSASSAYRSTTGAVSDTYGRASQAASSGYDNAVRSAQAAGSTISDAASGFVDRASDVTESVRERGARAGHYAQDRVAQLVEEQPLILGGIALALGAALGASLPRTRVEDRLIGETADHFKETVADAASEQYEHAKDVASETYDNVAKSVQESGVTEKVAEAVTTAADKIRETAESASAQAREKMQDSSDKTKKQINEAGPSKNENSSKL